jgi:hypothetical protein
MAEDPNAVYVGSTGDIWTAPENTAPPAAIATAPASPWVMQGFVSEDGVTIQPGTTVEDIRVWQSPFPVRNLITERTFQLTFALRQLDVNTVPFGFGGGEVVAGPPVEYDGPDPSTLDIRALLLDVYDGDKHNRIYVARGMVTELAEVQFQRGAAADLGITFAALADSTGHVFKWFSDDPGWTALAETAAKSSKAAA